MCRTLRRISWAIGVAVAAATFAISAGAAEDWRSEGALGNVVVSFAGFVRVYDNATMNPPQIADVYEVTVPGANQGLAFDAGLNLYVANTDSTSSLQKLPPDGTHVPNASISTQANPRSVVFAADGTAYVASRACTGTGSGTTCQGTIRRIETIPGSIALDSTEFTDFTVTLGSSSTCIGIDLDPDQNTLYIVDGATQSAQRIIWKFDVSTGMTSGTITLPGSGAACGIRVLPPARGGGAGLANRSFLIADRDNVKRVNGTGGLLESFDTFLSSANGARNWIDVDIDPVGNGAGDTHEFWAIDDGTAINNSGESLLAKFRIGSGPAALKTINTVDRPQGVTLNGALRAAQTIWLGDITATPNIARFVQGTEWEHWWVGSFLVNTAPTTPYAVQVFEVTSDGVAPTGEFPPPCPSSLDGDCRILANFLAVGKGYSRGRKVVYREIPLVSTTEELLIGIKFPDFVAAPGSGEACTPTTQTQPATALLRDPFPHDVFSLDKTIAVYPGDTWLTGRSNDTIAADRFDALYVAQMKKPTAGTRQNQGSTMQVEIQVREQGTCTIVSTLTATDLVLTATDVTQGSPNKGTPVADSEGIYESFTGNGITWTFLANVIRTNVYIDPALFAKGNTYKFCVNSKADPVTGMRPIGEVCQDVKIK